MKKKNLVKNICVDAMLLALLCVSALIAVNTGNTTFTLQLFVILLIGLITDLPNAMIIICSYILMGLIGIPVFANGGGGFAYAVMPTFGFVYGFIPGLAAQTLIMKAFNKCEKVPYQILGATIASIVCILLCYACGSVHFYLIRNFYLSKSMAFSLVLQLAIVPYIIFDLIKMAAAIAIYWPLKKALHLQKD